MNGLRVIVTGTGGRLGGAVARQLRERHRVVAWDRKALDLSRRDIILDHFGAVQFDAVIHCAAMTSLDECERHPGDARAVNTDAPALIAEICRDRGARMIHISTDYVYDGSRPGLRRESDPVCPVSVYASTKAEAETRVLAASPNHLVVRISWIFGPDRPGFPDHIIQRAEAEPRCEAVADKFSSPTSATEAAEVLEQLLALPHATGIVNLCNAGAASWHEYGQAALDLAAEAGVALKCRTVSPTTLSDMKAFAAVRPVHTAMDPSRVEELTGRRMTPWREALATYIRTYYRTDRDISS